MKASIEAAVTGHFRSEFLNSLDDQLVFRPLGVDQMLPIARVQVEKVAGMVRQQGTELVVSDLALQHISEAGYDQRMGTRPLRRAVQRLLQDPIADSIQLKPPVGGETWYIDCAEGPDEGLRIERRPMTEA